MSRTIAHPPGWRLAPPGGPVSAGPPRSGAGALASCPGLDEPGFGGGGLAAGWPGHAGAR